MKVLQAGCDIPAYSLRFSPQSRRRIYYAGASATELDLTILLTFKKIPVTVRTWGTYHTLSIVTPSERGSPAQHRPDPARGAGAAPAPAPSRSACAGAGAADVVAPRVVGAAPRCAADGTSAPGA